MSIEHTLSCYSPKAHERIEILSFIIISTNYIMYSVENEIQFLRVADCM